MKPKIKNALSKNAVLLYLVALSLHFNSCKKESVLNEQTLPSNINALNGKRGNVNNFKSVAKDNINFLIEWYNINKKERHTLSTLIPDWENVAYAEDEEYFTYEVDLFNPENIHTSSEKIETSDIKRKPLNTFRLLIYKNKKNAELSGGYLSVAPQDKVSNPKNTHIGIFANFSGKVTLFNMNGKFIKGVVYNNGEAIKSITYRNEQLDGKKIGTLYAKSSNRNSLMGNPIGETIQNDNCNYDLEPVYGQACV